MGSPRVRVVSHNLHGERVCASAARISTTKGDALQIFDRADDVQKNRQLIERVLASGHASVIEHAVFTLAFVDVSVFVEQFVIESRLASFTVKSRRYVDFSNMGYHTPGDLRGAERERYQTYMEALFSAYGTLLEQGVPKEDARFVLPYAFHSNFYCTLNARELVQLVRAMRFGRGKDVPELGELASQIVEEVGELLPVLRAQCERLAPGDEVGIAVPTAHGEARLLRAGEAGSPTLMQWPQDPEGLLLAAWRCARPGIPAPGELSGLLHVARPRELEQLSYTFRIQDITLSGLTHLTRHRVQSLIVPPLATVTCDRVILPESIAQNPQALATYSRAVFSARREIACMLDDPKLVTHRQYFVLSGATVDVMTTLDARELTHFMRLRTCNRAQWEIRNIAVRMLSQLRDVTADVFGEVGPSCFMDGVCPEGRMTCGRMSEVCTNFSKKELAIEG